MNGFREGSASPAGKRTKTENAQSSQVNCSEILGVSSDDGPGGGRNEDLLSGSEGEIQKRTTIPVEALLRGSSVLGNRIQGVSASEVL